MIHATIAGNIGRDPESKQIGDGSVLEFSLASNSRRKVEGQFQDVTDWVRVTIWGKRGESLGRILTKGSYVVVRGELTCREYTRKDGAAGYSLELRADDIELGPKRDGRRSAGTHHEHGLGQFPEAPSGTDNTSRFPDDDDIPF